MNGGTFVSTSTDGITWKETSTLPYSAYWCDVAYGNGYFVAIAGDQKAFGASSKTYNYYAYSTDGVNWSSGSLPVTASWINIQYVNNRFIITGNSDKLLYSTSGTSWSSATLPTTALWYDCAYGNNKYVLVGSGVGAYSSNGTTWSASTTSLVSASKGTSTQARYSGVAFGEGKFVAISDYAYAGAIWSKDGITWNTSVDSASNKYTSPGALYGQSCKYVTYYDNKFIATGNGDVFYSSTKY